ncbi:very short patch repair endonuclease [Nocardioides zeae]|uniref:DNA mismatch endonuclease (Patch repair protein) n=1 Tax=Nocardioides zeae TaxID=1457234 RepID=A0AAJ1U5S7_9ACTN|nr:very short patch repair endonuclease [Nocardioides zeae]MDQ1106068.1 DNA mismatch endonuclease (patch repair protein) [Nocardioides zeae]
MFPATRFCFAGVVSSDAPVPTEEPKRKSPGGALSRKMSTLARRDTKPEMALRRELHRRGMRFRVQMKVPGNNRRTIDIAFTKAKLAVYVDGCFWHGCPEHHHAPKSNAEWWRWKVERNRERDRDTDRELGEAGWRVLRIWEHEPVAAAGDLVQVNYMARLEQQHLRRHPN